MKITNRISVSAINDGVVVHGGLTCTKSLSQGYIRSTGKFVPDWTATGDSYHPTIYLTLLNGSIPCQPIGEYTWTWNLTQLSFKTMTSRGITGEFSENATVMIGNDSYPIFRKTTVSWNGFAMPALEICENLAVAGGLNNDTVTFSGYVEMSGEAIAFSSGIEIRLCELANNGYLGIISFKDGKSTLSSDQDTVEAWATLYNGDGVVSEWYCDWLYNGTKALESWTLGDNGAAISKGKGHEFDTIKVSGDENVDGVIDVATITCIFYEDKERKTQLAIAEEVIDDISDEEYLFVFFSINGSQQQSDGSPLSLRRGQAVKFDMWVAREDDEKAIDKRFTKFWFRPRNAASQYLPKSAIAALANAAEDADGFFEITVDVGDDKHGSFTLTFDEAVAALMNINGIVKATD